MAEADASFYFREIDSSGSITSNEIGGKPLGLPHRYVMNTLQGNPKVMRDKTREG
jgi:hypothetical protein